MAVRATVLVIPMAAILIGATAVRIGAHGHHHRNNHQCKFLHGSVSPQGFLLQEETFNHKTFPKSEQPIGFSTIDDPATGDDRRRR